MEKKAIQSNRVPRPAAEYSQGILAEGKRHLFISGQVPLDEQGNLVGKGDMAAQTRQVFVNLQSQLAEAGADFANVVELTVFVTDMSRFGEFAAVRKEYLPAPYPAATSVGVASLVHPDWLVEVEAVAVLD